MIVGLIGSIKAQSLTGNDFGDDLFSSRIYTSVERITSDGQRAIGSKSRLTHSIVSWPSTEGTNSFPMNKPVLTLIVFPVGVLSSAMAIVNDRLKSTESQKRLQTTDSDKEGSDQADRRVPAVRRQECGSNSDADLGRRNKPAARGSLE